MLGGVGLGFANVVRPGPVGIVAAAGTGAQEAMSLLDRWGVGVSQVIGVGGRDLSAEVGGRMATRGGPRASRGPRDGGHPLRLQAAGARGGRSVLATAGEKPLVAALIGLDPGFPAPPGVVLADTLESGVTATLGVLGHRGARHDRDAWVRRSSEARSRLAPGRRLIRGLFSGGTLCYEALVILGRTVGEVHSNTPINPAWGMPAPDGSHQCLDLGEEEYTRGRPHPMIDPEARIELLLEHAAGPAGGRDHPRCRARAWLRPRPREDSRAGVPVRDGRRRAPGRRLRPGHRTRIRRASPSQREQLVQAGCMVTETAARASLAAAAIATGDSSLARLSTVSDSSARDDVPRVALVTYSTKARGGVVHTLSLADALVDRNLPVRIVALGDPDQDFFRPVRAPYSTVPTSPPADTLEQRVFDSIDDLEAGLSKIADEVDILHTQDCISARAAARVRDAGAEVRVVRTVHHVDDFTTQALIDCQRKAIEEPDQLVVVSQDWHQRLRADYGVDARVIHNGVDADRFAPIGTGRRAAAEGPCRRGRSLRLLVRGRDRAAQGKQLSRAGDGPSQGPARPTTGPGGGWRALVPGLPRLPRRQCSRRCRVWGSNWVETS